MLWQMLKLPDSDQNWVGVVQTLKIFDQINQGGEGELDSLRTAAVYISTIKKMIFQCRCVETYFFWISKPIVEKYQENIKICYIDHLKIGSRK